MSKELSEVWKEESQPVADAAMGADLERYLTGLISDMNFRMFCDLEAGAYGFPKKILWVEDIMIYEVISQEAGGSYTENDCWEQGLWEKTEEKTLTGQIKYRLEQIKHYFTGLWKKKGR